VAPRRWVAAWYRFGRGRFSRETSFVRSWFLRFGGPEHAPFGAVADDWESRMSYQLLPFVHLLGLCLMAAGLIGVWYADVRSRQARDLRLFAETIRTVAAFYDGLVVPGVLLLLGSASG
jgi:hypothetical protein